MLYKCFVFAGLYCWSVLFALHQDATKARLHLVSFSGGELGDALTFIRENCHLSGKGEGRPQLYVTGVGCQINQNQIRKQLNVEYVIYMSSIRRPPFNYQGGFGIFELDKLFISPPVCNFYLFHTISQAKYVFHFLEKKSVYKGVSQARLIIDVGVNETSEARLNTFNRHLMMRNKARHTFLSASKYLFYN